MAEPYHGLVDTIWSYYDFAYDKYFDVALYTLFAENKWNEYKDHIALGYLIEAVNILNWGFNLLMTAKGGSPAEFYMVDALKALWEYDNEAGGELTPEAICEAWAKDDFAGRAITIAFIDRMRQILWDEPFSAVWAARPESE